MKQLSVAIVGLGSRGKDTYAPVALKIPDKMKIAAVADIDKEKVLDVAKKYNIDEKYCFDSADSLLDQEQLADVLFIATQDREHVAQALKAIKKGYHILLEKPISPLAKECIELVKTAKEYKKEVVVCHVLRYTPFYTELKRVLDTGIIGDIVSVMAIENVGYWHQAHSFVRGNWRNMEETSPMILAKCCHDMDLYLWLTGKTCKSVSSFGSTFLFKEDKAPKGATKRCLDGCKVKESCPYDAEKIYMNDKKIGVNNGHTAWPLDVLALYPSKETIKEAIEKGPYGRCVYYCDNDVVDHQVVNLEMTDGSTIHLTMSGFTESRTRYAKLMGTLGEIEADLLANTIIVKPFGKDEYIIDVSKLATDFSGHSGGDAKMVEEFLDLVSGRCSENDRITSIERSVESHYIALAAEESRLNGGKPININN